MPHNIDSLPSQGWLVIDKPSGMTSNRVNTRLRYLLGKRIKIGFAGTLDPLATGVLPIAIQETTRLIPYALGAPKTYIFTVQWGEMRDTDDAEGQVVQTSSHTPKRDEILQVLPSFLGDITQTPSTYSAIKIRGRRACDRTRAGEHIEMPQRTITIASLTLEEHDASQRWSRFQVQCSRGTYVRTLAHDIALRLNSCGYISVLRRTAVGPFDITQAKPLSFYENLLQNGERWAFQPACCVLDDIPDAGLTEAQALDICQGRSCTVEDLSLPDDQEVWLHGFGAFSCDVWGLGHVREGRIWPRRVFKETIMKGIERCR